MKKNIILIIGLVLGIILIIGYSVAKYKGKRSGEISLTSTPFYFEHNGIDCALPYNNNYIVREIKVQNFIGDNYTMENIEYQIFIDNSNYSLKVNEENTTNNIKDLVIERWQ